MTPKPRHALIALLASLVPAAICAQPVPMEYQYLYGSGEAAAQSIATFRQLTDYAHAEAARRKRGASLQQAVLTNGSDLEAPRFAPCGKKPLAVVFDIDETLLLNIGFERWLGLGLRPANVSVGKAWDQWEETGVEQVAPVPGAVAALRRLRTDGITVVFNSNRSTAHVDGTIKTLAFAHLAQADQARPGVTLFTDPTPASALDHAKKDSRRAKIAQRYCVIAMAGDQLGDFSDLFNAPKMMATSPSSNPPALPGRRKLTQSEAVERMWGHGWFVLPNSTYGTQVNSHASEETVFPDRSMDWSYNGAIGTKP